MTKTKPLLPYLIVEPSGARARSFSARLRARHVRAVVQLRWRRQQSRGPTSTSTRARARTHIPIDRSLCSLVHTPSNAHALLRIFTHTRARHNCIVGCACTCVHTVNHISMLLHYYLGITILHYYYYYSRTTDTRKIGTKPLPCTFPLNSRIVFRFSRPAPVSPLDHHPTVEKSRLVSPKTCRTTISGGGGCR